METSLRILVHETLFGEKSCYRLFKLGLFGILERRRFKRESSFSEDGIS